MIELYIYDQLYKIIEDCDSIDKIDDEYLPICENFLEFIEGIGIDIMTDSKVHELLNTDTEKKKQLFLVSPSVSKHRKSHIEYQ